VVVGICRLTLLAPQCHSLKEKRSVIRKIKDRTRARFHLALSEVGAQDTWQRVVLGFALVSSDRSVVENGLGDVVGFIEAMGLASLAGDEREILTYGDAPLSGNALGRALADGGDPYGNDAGMDADWIPESWKAADAGEREPTGADERDPDRRGPGTTPTGPAGLVRGRGAR
jgi:uncharacterized protein YlxP (DUF503 family)